MNFVFSVATAVEAALRGDETPSRVDSISFGLKSGQAAPASSNSVLPPIPQHSSSSSLPPAPPAPTTSTNNRQGSSRSRNEPRPPVPVVRVPSRGEIAPPLPNRIMSPTTNKVSDLPTQPQICSGSPGGSKEGPPLPSRVAQRTTKLQPAKSGRGKGGAVNVHQKSSPQITPPVIGGGELGVVGATGPRTSLPTLPSRPAKPQTPGRPKLASLPNKPVLSKKPAIASGSGRGKGTGQAVSIPSPDGMTPRQMVDFFLREAPAVISNIQDGVGNIPTLLEDFITFGEAIADQARGRSVQFRIEMSKFRSGLGNLKKFANVAWYNSVGQIVEDINTLVSGLNVLSQSLSE